MTTTPDSLAQRTSRTVDDLRPGMHARIRSHRSNGAIRQRLLDLGLMPNAEIVMVRTAPLGDPIELKLDGGNISLRRHEAATIEVHSDD